MYHPIVAVPGGYIRLDLLTHTAAIEGDKEYIKLHFVSGRSEIYHREDLAAVLLWLEIQAEHYTNVYRALSRPSWDHRLDLMVDEGVCHSDEES